MGDLLHVATRSAGIHDVHPTGRTAVERSADERVRRVPVERHSGWEYLHDYLATAGWRPRHRHYLQRKGGGRLDDGDRQAGQSRDRAAVGHQNRAVEISVCFDLLRTLKGRSANDGASLQRSSEMSEFLYLYRGGQRPTGTPE